MLRLFSTINYSTGERLQKLLLQILLLQKHIICLMAFYLCWFLRLQGKVIETNYWTSWRGIFALLNSKKKSRLNMYVWWAILFRMHTFIWKYPLFAFCLLLPDSKWFNAKIMDFRIFIDLAIVSYKHDHQKIYVVWICYKKITRKISITKWVMQLISTFKTRYCSYYFVTI